MRVRATIPAVDWLKAIAIVAVVVGHSGPFALNLFAMDLDRYVRAVVVAFHVPVFLFLSGYLHATATPMTGADVWRRWRGVLGAYLVASLVMLTFAVERNRPLARWPWDLLTGGAAGIYYYVPVWLGCVLTGWLWSRLGAVGLAAALGGVTALTVARNLWIDVPLDFYWMLRDPLFMGWLFFYVLGWCARRCAWDAWVWAHRWSAVVAVACCAPWLGWNPGGLSLARMVYSVGVAWLAFALVTAPAPAIVRWLASETLLLYLWHMPIAQALARAMGDAPVVVRLPVVAAATLLATAAGIVAWRRIRPAPVPATRLPEGV